MLKTFTFQIMMFVVRIVTDIDTVDFHTFFNMQSDQISYLDLF